MYSVTWHVYPNDIEGEEMDADFEYFKSLARAKSFLRQKIDEIGSIYWAGGYIEDDNGEWVVTVTDSGEWEEKTV